MDRAGNVVMMSLDCAELQAKRHQLMRMQAWADNLDAFLRFNEYKVLQDAGRVSAAVAKKLAEDRCEVFRVEQDRTWRSDFDRLVERAESLEPKEDE